MNRFLELIHLAQLKFCTSSLATPPVPLPQSLGTSVPLFASVSFRYLHIRGIIPCLCFGDWFLSFCLTFSSFIHVSAYCRVFLFFMAGWYSIVRIHHFFFIHSSKGISLKGSWVLLVIFWQFHLLHVFKFFVHQEGFAPSKIQTYLAWVQLAWSAYVSVYSFTFLHPVYIWTKVIFCDLKRRFSSKGMR